MSVDEGWLKILNPDNDLRRSLAFGGSPWKVEVERVKGIEPSYSAWEAAALPLSYTRAAQTVIHTARRWQRESEVLQRAGEDQRALPLHFPGLPLFRFPLIG